jgi:PEP-CTERM motif
MKLRNVLAAIGACALAGISTPSLAVLTFQLTSDHCTGGCLTGQASGGTITVTQTAANTLSFNVVLNNGNLFLDTGQDATLAFDLAGNPVVTFSGLTAGWSVVGGSPTGAQSLHMDGTGTFEYGVSCKPTACGNGGTSGAPGPLNFIITAAGLTENSIQRNASLQFFGVDILSGTTGRTGFVDASVGGCTAADCPPDIPEPQTLALLGLGLFALAMARRKSNA